MSTVKIVGLVLTAFMAGVGFGFWFGIRLIAQRLCETTSTKEKLSLLRILKRKP